MDRPVNSNSNSISKHVAPEMDRSVFDIHIQIHVAYLKGTATSLREMICVHCLYIMLLGEKHPGCNWGNRCHLKMCTMVFTVLYCNAHQNYLTCPHLLIFSHYILLQCAVYQKNGYCTPINFVHTSWWIRLWIQLHHCCGDICQLST